MRFEKVWTSLNPRSAPSSKRSRLAGEARPGLAFMRLRSSGIVRPVMFRILRAHVFRHVAIAAGPEGGQIFRQCNLASRRRKKRNSQRNSAIRNRRMGAEPVKFLGARLNDR